MTSDVVLDIFISMGGGAIASWVAIVLWELRQRARLRFRCCSNLEEAKLIQTVVRDPNNPTDTIKRAVHHVYVENAGNNTASECKATISVLGVDGVPLHRAVEGIWNRGLQPMLYTPIPTPGSSRGNLSTGMGPIAKDSQVIWGYSPHMPGRSGYRLPVVIKYEGDESCYLFDLNTYVDPNLGEPRVASRQLRAGRYYVVLNVEFDSPRRSEAAVFQLSNFGSALDGVELRYLGSRLPLLFNDG